MMNNLTMTHTRKTSAVMLVGFGLLVSLLAFLALGISQARASVSVAPAAALSVPLPAGAIIVGETGAITLTDSIDGGFVGTVSLANSYADPVVVAFINTRNDNEAINVRVHNVTQNGFEIFMEEPDNGTHGTERVSYIVVEKGHHAINGGIEVEAGTVDTDSVHRTGQSAPRDGVAVDFAPRFRSTPIVLTTLNSYNNGAFMSSVAYEVTAGGFSTQRESVHAPPAVSETIAGSPSRQAEASLRVSPTKSALAQTAVWTGFPISRIRSIF